MSREHLVFLIEMMSFCMTSGKKKLSVSGSEVTEKYQWSSNPNTDFVKEPEFGFNFEGATVENWTKSTVGSDATLGSGLGNVRTALQKHEIHIPTFHPKYHVKQLHYNCGQCTNLMYRNRLLKSQTSNCILPWYNLTTIQLSKNS